MLVYFLCLTSKSLVSLKLSQQVVVLLLALHSIFFFKSGGILCACISNELSVVFCWPPSFDVLLLLCLLLKAYKSVQVIIAWLLHRYIIYIVYLCCTISFLRTQHNIYIFFVWYRFCCCLCRWWLSSALSSETFIVTLLREKNIYNSVSSPYTYICCSCIFMLFVFLSNIAHCSTTTTTF